MTRIFFATDVHGSDKCWIKFLNAGDYYEADVIILGGDMTGKGIVPIVEQPDGAYKATFLDHKEILNSVPEVEQLEKKIRATGLYPYRINKKEMEEFEASPAKVDELFNTLMFQSVEKWMKIADERLSGKKIKCFVCPGNDDRPEID
jgi:Icc-related predicted phosphoesterase